MLKGKAKIDFEQWLPTYLGEWFDILRNPFDLDVKVVPQAQTMQQGVLLEFFRERGIDVSLKKYGAYGTAYEYEVSQDDFEADITTGHSPDYNTAFTHAIDKACEIYGGEG